MKPLTGKLKLTLCFCVCLRVCAQAVSAFAPICNPVQCPWGQKAFSGYLGSDRTTWEVSAAHPPPPVRPHYHSGHGDTPPFPSQAYDATTLAASYSGPRLDVLIDQGRDDQFLSAGQLLPDNLLAVCSKENIPVVFRLQEVRRVTQSDPVLPEPSLTLAQSNCSNLTESNLTQSNSQFNPV